MTKRFERLTFRESRNFPILRTPTMKISRLAKKLRLLLATFFGIALVFFFMNNGHGVMRNYGSPHYQSGAAHSQIINVFFVMTSPEDSFYLPAQLKSIFYYSSSPVFLHLFVSSDLLERIVTTLLFSWQAEAVLFKVYRLLPTQVPTTTFQLLDCFRKHLPLLFKKGVYMSKNVLFKSDVLHWMERCSSVSIETTALTEETGCREESMECSGAPNLMYVDLERIFDDRDKIKLGILPCHLSPFQRNQSECSTRQGHGVDGILVVNRSDFYADRYAENLLHLFISESIMSIDSSPPNAWSYIQSSDSSVRSFEIFFKSLEQLKNYSFHAMSGAWRHFGRTLNTTEKPECQKFLDIAYLKRRTHLFYHCGNQWVNGMEKVSTADKDISVTMMTVLTLDRFSSLEKMLSHWKGPSAVLLYLSDVEASRKLPRLMKNSKVLNNRDILDRTAIHVVYQRLPYNPLNYLRNVLLNNTFTSHVFYLDVDLPPNPDIYVSILKHLKQERTDDKKLFIVPAFISSISLENSFPKTKQELLKFIKEETITGYNQKRGWSLGHKPTNYSHWLKADKPYQAIFKDAFEPYVIAPRSLQAYFNEDLIERMGDKIAYTRLIHGMGYDYYVLPDDFVIHLPHPSSLGTSNYFTEPNLYKCGSFLFEKYRKKLYEMFPGRKF